MTIHPLLKLVLTKPQLLGEHAEAYAALIGDEAKKASVSLAVRASLYAGAAVLAVLGVLLVGVALLLRATITSSDLPAGWALIVVPLAPFLIAVGMVFMARSKPVDSVFAAVKNQLNADMSLLREVSTK